MRHDRFRKCLGFLVLVLCLGGAERASARTCFRVAFGDPGAEGSYDYVLKNVALRAGNAGAIDGYSIRTDGFVEPISGGYAVAPGGATIGITRYVTGIYLDGAAGSQPATAFLQISLPLDGLDGSFCGWRREGNGSQSATCGVAERVECKSVPAIPKKFPPVPEK